MPTCLSCANRALLRVILFIFLLLVCSSAFAVLGQDVSSVQSDGAHLKTAVRILPGRNYSIHELRASSGTAVKEFVSPAGQVFGISWQGPVTPDLRQLLGDHFDQYMQAAQTTPHLFRRVVHIETGDLVFESGGHMRFIVGRAYLRSKLPDGVGVDDIR
jgi:Protein of unknown function (DUF2844)